MPFTTEHLTQLTTAIAQGATTVKYGDKEVTYRSLTEMKELLEMIKTEVEPSPAGTYPKGRRFAEFSKGL